MMVAAKIAATIAFVGGVVLTQEHVSLSIAILCVAAICGGLSVIIFTALGGDNGEQQKNTPGRNTNGGSAVDLHHRVDSPRGH